MIDERLDVEAEALARFLAEDDGEPIVLVNLVRLRAGGEEAYRAYGAAVAPLLERVGAELVYTGTARGCLIGDEPWDVAVVTRYPSRSALAELVADPAFEAAGPLRHAALEAGILHAFA